MRLACLSCGFEHDVAEGTNLRLVRCPRCGSPPAAHFPHEKFVRFESADHPLYAKAAEHAGRGETDAALAALEELLAGGYDDLERIGADRALAAVRADPRYRELMKRHRP